MTRDALTAALTPASGARCCRCRNWTTAPVPVRYIERASGPGMILYACPSHAVAFTPGPIPGELDNPA